MFETIKNDLKTKAILLYPSFFFALLVLIPFISRPFSHMPKLTDFSDRLMSGATASGLSIDGRIRIYYLVLTGLMLCFFLVFFLMSRCFTCGDSNLLSKSDSYKVIKDLSIIGIVGGLGSILANSQEIGIYYLGTFMMMYLVHLKKKEVGLLSQLWCFSISIPLSLMIWTIVRGKVFLNLGLGTFLSTFSFSKDSGYAFLLWLATYILFVICWGKFQNIAVRYLRLSTEQFKSLIFAASLPIMCSVIVQSFLLEGLNIVNKRFNLVLYISKELYLVTLFGSILLTIIIGRRVITKMHKNQEFVLDNERLVYRFCFPIVLITIGILIAQPSRLTTVGNEFFEMANHGLAVDQLFRYGSIPLVENFDAHMLSNQLFGIIYSLLNGYEPWAAFLYDKYIIVLYVIVLYFIFVPLIGNINSFFFVFSFPLIESLFGMTYVFSAIMIFFIYKSIKEKRWMKNSIQFWVMAFILCLYRLDLGASALLAGVSIYTLILIKDKKFKSLIRFYSVGIGLVISMGTLFALICLMKNINPLRRIIEIIKISQSNQSWAYPTTGDIYSIPFTIGYYILPVLLFSLFFVGCIFYVFRGNESLKDNITSLLSFLFFSSFTFFNISRGIVRHSLAEGTLLYALGASTFAIVSLVVLLGNNKGRVLRFSVASLILVVMVNINYPSLKYSNSFISKALDSENYYQQYDRPNAFKGTRVSGEEPTVVKELKVILDTLLDKDQTYFDFSSNNYFHALVGRKNPVYVNQSPLLIAGDMSQELMLDEIKENEPPIVLMPIPGNQWSYIDGIAVDFKYYLISEYINENYSPLLRMGTFDVYITKANKEIYLSKLKEKGLLSKTLYTGAFDKNAGSTLKRENANVSVGEDNSIIIDSSSGIAELTGELSDWLGFDLANPTVSVDKSVVIKMSYRSEYSGQLSILSSGDGGGSFSETATQTYESKNGEKAVEISLPELPKQFEIRTDMRSVSLLNISVEQELNRIDEQPEIWTRDLGQIAKLWAENDGISTYEETPNLVNPIMGNSVVTLVPMDLIKGQPIMFVAKIQSNTNEKAYLQMENRYGEKLGEYAFDLSQGTHDYAIRVSSDYKWWNGKVDAFRVKLPDGVSVSKLYMASINGEKYYELKNGFNLSNLSDANWENGVGINLNYLLFDATLINVNNLEIGKKLIFADGTEAFIKTIKKVNQYLYVEVDKDLTSLRTIAAYPKLIKILD